MGRISNCDWGLALGYDAAATNVTVTRSQFVNSSSYGIDLTAADAVVSKNVFQGGRGQGVWVRDTSPGAHIERNRFVAMIDAIFMEGTNGTLARNVITKATGNGIFLAGSGGNTVDRNVVKGSGADGFNVSSGGNTFTSNKVSGSGDVDLSSTVPESANTYTSNHFGTKRFP